MTHPDFLSRNPTISDSDNIQIHPRVVNFAELEKDWIFVEQQRDINFGYYI